MTLPVPTASPPALPNPILSCSEIANRIRARRGQCNRITVWRAIRRLGLVPVHQTEKGYCFYSSTQADLIEVDLRRANRKSGND